MELQQENTFESLSLKEGLLKGVYIYGFKTPSTIQVDGITAINSGTDCIIQSQSGTGKTTIFILGVLNNLVENDKCQAIIISPTRELSKQIYTFAREISQFTNYKIALCVGGTSIHDNKTSLKNANVIIGTLGRINHMVNERKISLGNIKILVLDEADELLEDGLSEELSNICSNIPPKSQKCFISATISKNVLGITNELMTDPQKILLKKEEIVVELISQYYYDIEKEEDKLDLLLDLYNLINSSQAIIFCNTIRKVEWITEKMEEENFSITSIHGDMTSKERNQIVKDFRDGKTRILITTDLLSRGIDINQVNLVINYDLPLNKSTYIHRIGRCGRFGKQGVAISFVKMNDHKDLRSFNKMKKYYNMNIDELTDDVFENI